MSISSAYSSAVDSSASGQPGNALPLNMPGSSDVKFLDYGLMAGFHRPVNRITYSSAGNTIGSSMSGSFIYYDGPAATAGAAFAFTLPDPQPGLWFEITSLGAVGCSAVTTFNAASATGCFYIAGDSGGADGVAYSATTVDQLCRLEFIGFSTAGYIVNHKLTGASSGLVSTAAYIGPAASS